MDYQPFFNFLEKQTQRIVRMLNDSKRIRAFSHLDADGLCCAGMISLLLLKLNKEYHISILKQLTDEHIKDIEENYDLYIFTDLGSGKIEELKEKLKEKKIIVIDHHPPKNKVNFENIIHINPHLFNIDGGTEVSASTLTYLVVKKLGLENCEHLPIVGTLGDLQEIEGKLTGINKLVIEKIDKIEIKKGLRIFGRISKPIYKALAHSTDPYIPGVSGDESSAIQFLSEIGIEIKNEDGFKSFEDLSEDEKKRLISGIILKRMNTKNPEDLFKDIYILKNKEGILSDAHEFATLLNSCGRQGEQSIGILLCMGEEKDALKKAKESILEYKKKIISSLEWYENNKRNPDKVRITENTIYLIAKDEIPDTMIGTICSMISSNEKKPFVVGFANTDNGVKVSARTNTDKDIGKIIKDVVMKIGGSDAGGHAKAAGAKIEIGRENEFILLFEEKVKNINMKKIAQ